MISISRESSEALRWTFAVHESTHAIFFSDADYRGFARALWSSLDRREKWFWKTYFGWAGYDVGVGLSHGQRIPSLSPPAADRRRRGILHEAQELPSSSRSTPSSRRKWTRTWRSSALRSQQRAKTLEAWLYGKYGIEAGRTVLVTRAGN